jgi:hypothetical protein
MFLKKLEKNEVLFFCVVLRVVLCGILQRRPF